MLQLPVRQVWQRDRLLRLKWLRLFGGAAVVGVNQKIYHNATTEVTRRGPGLENALRAVICSLDQPAGTLSHLFLVRVFEAGLAFTGRVPGQQSSPANDCSLSFP